MKIYSVLGNQGFCGFVKEEDLELVKCSCKGELKKTHMEEQQYGTKVAIALECQTCKGSYSATEEEDPKVLEALK